MDPVRRRKEDMVKGGSGTRGFVWYFKKYSFEYILSPFGVVARSGFEPLVSRMKI